MSKTFPKITLRMAKSVIILLFLFLKLLSAKDISNNYILPPNECAYTQKNSENEELALSCYLDSNNFNLSIISNEHITSFTIICDLNSLFNFTQDKTFIKINKLKEISLINCKFNSWTSHILHGLNELKNLTINTRK
jgi:hypothetical protein